MAKSPAWKRVAWFVAIWVASVAALTVVAYAIRLAIV
ncbi:Protein of unknown function [Loktanella sp. DSM 29012]|nr:DUF2474 family protein [Loktanella sp. DSM 29012]SEQ47662.1 Protein of unknown function [Loktanella sp. DSM 29012]